RRGASPSCRCSAIVRLENLADRLPSPPFQDNSEHLIAVQFRDGQWHYNDNSDWLPFVPLKSDRLIAEVDFDNETMVDLKGRQGRVEGVEQGYLEGDLVFLPFQWNGRPNDGEFTVEGTYLDVVVSTPQLTTVEVESIDQGIAVADDATGHGYILFSAEDLFERLPSPGPRSGNDRQMIAVRYVDDRWQYNSNSEWVEFAPEDSDRLIAKLDFDQDTIEPLLNAVGTVHGIDQGYYGGDLEFLANQWNGKPNEGEFSVRGSFFHVESDAPLATASADGSGDTNSDGLLSASDALRVINHLDSATTAEFAIDSPFDVNKDGVVSPRDALNVINLLSSQTGNEESGEAEGVASVNRLDGFGLGAQSVDFLFGNRFSETLDDEEEDRRIGEGLGLDERL
ncbi:MAG: dockerin type I domain-containing protein, partial [Planctomycetota bacterium]